MNEMAMEDPVADGKLVELTYKVIDAKTKSVLTGKFIFNLLLDHLELLLGSYRKSWRPNWGLPVYFQR